MRNELFSCSRNLDEGYTSFMRKDPISCVTMNRVHKHINIQAVNV